MHPFRFGAMVGAANNRREWVEQVRLAESVGCSTIFCSDHISGKLGPLPALASAAEISSLKVGTLVLNNDFRHPALLAKDAATIDLLSEGRLELGIGAGWLGEDYRRSGIPLDPAPVRVERLEEAVTVMKGLWGDGLVDHVGKRYSVQWEGAPPPHRRPHPTLLIGGGGSRMLRIAGREADIVGISLRLEEGTREAMQREIASVSAERLARRVGWIREGAGERFDQLELNVLTFAVRITENRRRAAEELAGNAEAGIATPHYLVGTVEQICEELEERRERFGISYVVIQHDDLRAAAPVIERLTGT